MLDMSKAISKTVQDTASGIQLMTTTLNPVTLNKNYAPQFRGTVYIFEVNTDTKVKSEAQLAI